MSARLHIRFSVFLLFFVFVYAEPSSAQNTIDQITADPTLSTRTIQSIALITILSLAPGIAIMVTCCPFIVTVLSILRQAIGLQQSPPNMLIVSLALFLTYFIMEQVFVVAWTSGAAPFIEGSISIEEALVNAVAPFRSFMVARIDGETFTMMADLRPDSADFSLNSAAPLSLLIPSFLLSEISLAFQIGFLIFLPFLIIDLVVAAVLMSMGMMMVPPAIVSLPFKLAFFVVADGWSLVTTALVRGYFT